MVLFCVPVLLIPHLVAYRVVYKQDSACEEEIGSDDNKDEDRFLLVRFRSPLVSVFFERRKVCGKLLGREHYG